MEIFDEIDADGNGAHSKKELSDAYHGFMEEYCGAPPIDDTELKTKAKKAARKLVKMKQDHECPTKKEQKELRKAFDDIPDGYEVTVEDYEALAKEHDVE